MASHQEANPIPAEVNQPPPSMEQFVRMLHDELRQTQQRVNLLGVPGHIYLG